MDDLAARCARVKPLVWRVQAPHTTDVVSGETVVLVAMLPWGAVAITKTLKETGYRVCEGVSRTGGFASMEAARHWFEEGYRRTMAAVIELAEPISSAAISAPAPVLNLWEETAGQPWPQPLPLTDDMQSMIADGWLRVADKGACRPEPTTAMLQWTPAARLAMSRTHAI